MREDIKDTLLNVIAGGFAAGLAWVNDLVGVFKGTAMYPFPPFGDPDRTAAAIASVLVFFLAHWARRARLAANPSPSVAMLVLGLVFVVVTFFCRYELNFEGPRSWVYTLQAAWNYSYLAMIAFFACSLTLVVIYFSEIARTESSHHV